MKCIAKLKMPPTTVCQGGWSRFQGCSTVTCFFFMLKTKKQATHRLPRRTLLLIWLVDIWKWLLLNKFGLISSVCPFIGSKAATAVRSTRQTTHTQNLLPSKPNRETNSSRNFESYADTPRCHIPLPAARLSLPASPAFPLVRPTRRKAEGGGLRTEERRVWLRLFLLPITVTLPPLPLRLLLWVLNCRKFSLKRNQKKEEKFGFTVERVIAGTDGDAGGCLGTFCDMETYVCLAVMKLKCREKKKQLWTFWRWSESSLSRLCWWGDNRLLLRNYLKDYNDNGRIKKL